MSNDFFKGVFGTSPLGYSIDLDNLVRGAGKVYGSFVHPYDREDTEYERNLQQTIFEREDNAVQRKVADLEKAGLSPVLATGAGANAGQAISARHEDANPLEAVNFYMGMKQNMANISRTRAEQERIDLQNQIDAYNFDKAKELGISTGAVNSQYAALANAITYFADKVFKGSGVDPSGAGEVSLISALAEGVSNLGASPNNPAGPKLASYLYNGGRITNEDGETFSPNDMMDKFPDYNTYVHQCKIAGVEPFDLDTWSNVKYHRSNNKSSSEKHNGAGGSW